jgi:ATP-binding cassette subfamily F protein 2
MAPSASKQKRLAEKAAKNAAKSGKDGSTATSSSTPTGSGASTPLTSAPSSIYGGSSLGPGGAGSKQGSQEDVVLSMKTLAIKTDRSAAGVLVSDVKGRDIKMDAYTLSFHGRLLIEGAEVSLNYGNRYGLLGENGSGKVRLRGFVLVWGRWMLIGSFLSLPLVFGRRRRWYPRIRS